MATQETLFPVNPVDALILTLQTDSKALARNSDPITSHEAADLWTRHKLSHAQTIVLSFFLKLGCGTDGELEDWVNKTYKNDTFAPSSLRKRRGELVAKEILTDSGRKDLWNGSRMIVWQLNGGAR